MYMTAEYTTNISYFWPAALIVGAIMLGVFLVVKSKKNKEYFALISLPCTMLIIALILFFEISYIDTYNDYVKLINESNVEITASIPENCKLIRKSGSVKGTDYYVTFECKTLSVYGYSKDIEIKIPASLSDIPFEKITVKAVKRDAINPQS